MKLLGILILAVFLFYLLINFTDSTPDFEEEFQYVRIDEVSITHQQSSVQITNVSSDTLDQIVVEYTVIPTDDARSDREIEFESSQEYLLNPGETMMIRSRSAHGSSDQQVHYKLDSVDYRVAPF